jgi:hypothetical protein
MLHAAQYVQDQVRYASISIGRGAYRPTKPEEVLERNFGDCKDKSLLLAMILRELGVEAVPALVNSQQGKTLPESLPSPYAFDHAIVHLQWGGQAMWVDPTAPKRYSLLSPRDPPDYESALLLARPIGGLYNIPRPAIDSQKRVVTRFFSLSAENEGPASLLEIDSYTGSLADGVRATLASIGRAQFELHVRNDLGSYYPDAKPLAPMAVEDHPESNLVEIQTRYRLEHSFVKDRDGVSQFMIHAQELYPYAEPLDSSVRHSPLAIQFPLQLHEHITVMLPADWTIQPSTTEVRNPTFRYQSRLQYSHRRLDIDYDYTALADHVDVSALSRYEADRKRVLDDIGYFLTNGTPAQSRGLGVAPVPLLVLVAALAAGVWLALRWGYRYDPQPLDAASGAPVGLGGWLTLVSLSVCVAPLISLYAISAWLEYLDVNVWEGLRTAVSAGYRGWAQPVVLALMALSALELIAHVLVMVLFFRRRSSTPTLLIVVLWFSTVVNSSILLFLGSSGLYQGSDLAADFSAIFWSLVWTIYLCRSERVKATFTRRLTSSLTANSTPITSNPTSCQVP